MLANLILETANAPGTSADILLAGAATGRRAFRSAFASGSNCYFFVTDGTQTEWDYGPLTVGTPDKISRSTVIGNTAGTTARLNFAGAVQVYCDEPAEKRPYFDAGDVMTTANRAIDTGTAYGQFAEVRSASNVVIDAPSGQFKPVIMKTGGVGKWLAGADGSDDYRIGRYAAGAVFDYPLWIAAATGKITLTQPLAVPAAASAADAVNLGQLIAGTSSTTGWTKIPRAGANPLILQYGYISSPLAQGTQAWPIAWPTVAWTAQLQVLDSAAQGITGVITSINVNSFTFSLSGRPTLLYFYGVGE